MKNYNIFIQLCNTLTRVLTEKYHLNQNTTMGQAIRITRRKNPIISHHYERLNAYTELRNVLVHEQYDEVIAEPSDTVIQTLRHVVNKLENPLRLKDLFKGQVYCVDTNETLSDVLSLIQSKRITHFPVFNNELFLGLLTDNGITHYIADHQFEINKNFDQVKVSELLRFEEHLTHSIQMHPHKEAYEMIHIFNDKNHRVRAILLTDVKQLSHPKHLKGILLPHDILTKLNDIIGSFEN